MLLAERWTDERDRRHALEAELHLHYLLAQTDSPEIAARAQYALARLLTRHGLLADAVEAYRALARDFPGVAVHDGKAGAALLDDLAADKRFFAYLDDPLAARPAGRVKFVELAENAVLAAAELPCDPQDGVAPPPAAATCASASTPRRSPSRSPARTGPTSRGRCRCRSRPPISGRTSDPGGYAITYQASGHFLVLSLGPVLVGVDRIERRARWVRSLLPGDLPPTAQLAPGGADGSISVQLDSRGPQRLGLLGPIGPNGVFVQTKAGVAALDLATGDLRWLRSDPAWMLDAFGDEQHLYLVESHAAGDVRAVAPSAPPTAWPFGIPDGVDVYNHKLGTLGRCVLASSLGAGDAVELRFYDVQTGQDLWKKTFPAHALVLESAVSELTAVAAPEGTVTVIDLAAAEGTAAAGRRSEAPGQGRPRHPVAGPHPVLPGVSGDGHGGQRDRRPRPEHGSAGKIHGGQRHDIRLRPDHRRPELEHPGAVAGVAAGPFRGVAGFAVERPANAPGGRARAAATMQVASMRSIDKRTGKVLYRKEQVNSTNMFTGLEIDVRTGTIDLISADHEAPPLPGGGQGVGSRQKAVADGILWWT